MTQSLANTNFKKYFTNNAYINPQQNLKSDSFKAIFLNHCLNQNLKQTNLFSTNFKKLSFFEFSSLKSNIQKNFFSTQTKLAFVFQLSPQPFAQQQNLKFFSDDKVLVYTQGGLEPKDPDQSENNFSSHYYDIQKSIDQTSQEDYLMIDFTRLDLRIGRIVECWKHPESDQLYFEKIDLNEGELRLIGSGLQQHVSLEDMNGLVVIASNLRPRKLAGLESNGMVMCASRDDKIEFLRPHEDSQVGERIILENKLYYDQEKENQLTSNQQKKIVKNVFPLLKTDKDGYFCFNGIKLITKAGYIKSQTLTDAEVS